MADAFTGEIRMVGFDYPPRGWAFCDGQLLPIAQNTQLFSLLGTKYGGDGASTFALPDFRGRTPIHQGQGHDLGESGGQETVTLPTQSALIPQNPDKPTEVIFATGYIPINNMQPYLTVSFIIALTGLFPPRP
ncbi:MAG TPA: tail fiber protein [Pyrinomonadaceae bacterium]|nr:tail fiber protein [Pyrinomonadaceae bacterium]